MQKKTWINIFIILIITVLTVLISIPNGPDLGQETKIHLGLDLQGGSQLTYELNTSSINDITPKEAAQSTVDVIDRRINSLGVSEPSIQFSQLEDNYSVIVQLPGIENIKEATDLIGQTAQLEFWEPNTTETDELASSWTATQLNGSHLRKAAVEFDQTSGNPYVALEFNDDGKNLFANITKRNIGQPVAIVLDNEIISAPTVQSEITDGNAIITGSFTITEAKNLTKLLNAGALPVPIELVEQRNVNATLGAQSVQKSILAGIVGILLVIIFMIVVYKLPGLIASIALVIYGLIIISIFKTVPITLTLAGVAGFIVSFGMAVDANVLIFARIKEEIKKEVPIDLAIKEGYKRAFSSIFDSNISTLITTIILYILTTSLVKGFAVTLGIGIIVSMFTAIFITKNLLLIFINTKLEKYLKI